MDLLRLLFPGFFDEKLIHSSEIKVETAALLDSVLGKLEDEIRKSLEYNPPADLPKKNITTAAHNLTVEFLGSLPRVREILQTDVEAAFNGDPAAMSKEEIIVSYPFIEAIAVQRLAHELYLKNVALIPRIMTEWAHARTGMDLHPGAQIGSHFFVDHCTGTVVGETAIIGNHVKMYHGVTLGAKSTARGQQLRGKKRHPTIEDRVTIYPGATILGGETVIGEGSTIGGNVFIMDSVAPNSLVIYDGLDMRVLNKAEQERRRGFSDLTAILFARIESLIETRNTRPERVFLVGVELKSATARPSAIRSPNSANWPRPPAAKSSATACKKWNRRRPPRSSARARRRNSPDFCQANDVDTVIFDDDLSPAQMPQPGKNLRVQNPRPHVAHSRHLRPARPDARRQAADRTGAAPASAAAPHAVLGPLVAATRRHRHARRRRRIAARSRPPQNFRAH